MEKSILNNKEKILLKEKEKYVKRKILDIFFENDIETLRFKKDEFNTLNNELESYIDVLNSINYIKNKVI